MSEFGDTRWIKPGGHVDTGPVTFRRVHVHRGRLVHLANGDYRTWCDQQWVATITGPPASERPLCERCLRWAGIIVPARAS